MYNKVILIGNLTKDPELRYTPQGTPVCTMRIASTQKYKSGDAVKEDTLFIDVVVWGKQGETAAQYLAKGKSALIEGRLQERRWETDGKKNSKFEIVAQVVRFLGGPGGKKDAANGTGGEGGHVEETTDLEPF